MVLANTAFHATPRPSSLIGDPLDSERLESGPNRPIRPGLANRIENMPGDFALLNTPGLDMIDVPSSCIGKLEGTARLFTTTYMSVNEYLRDDTSTMDSTVWSVVLCGVCITRPHIMPIVHVSAATTVVK